MAEGVVRHLAEEAGLTDQLELDSAATGAWHTGSPPDERAQETLRQCGLDISGQRARAITRPDFEYYDLILAMDTMNTGDLMEMCPPEFAEKIRLFLSYAPETGVKEVPDPYYGGSDGFKNVLSLIEQAGKNLLAELQAQ